MSITVPFSEKDASPMLQMTCGTKENYCGITMSPWIQLRTRGLLGTPDHDQSNDFLTARNQVYSIFKFMKYNYIS